MKGTRLLSVCLVVVAAGFTLGCGSGEASVTKADEEAFRNPPKEIPPESLKAMQEARERSARMAADAQKRSSGGQ